MCLENITLLLYLIKLRVDFFNLVMSKKYFFQS